MNVIVADKRLVDAFEQPLYEAPEGSAEEGVTTDVVPALVARPPPFTRWVMFTRSLPRIVLSLAVFYRGWLLLGTPSRMAVFMEAIYLQGRADSASQIRSAANALAPNRKARRALARKS